MARVKKRLALRFPVETVNEPITYNLIKHYDIEVNILNADISHGREGNLLVEIRGEGQYVDRAMAYLEEKKVQISPAVKTIQFHQEACIHCGACTAVCFSDALVMDAQSRKLEFFPERCVACEHCIKACPLGLFKLNFGLN